MSLRRSQIAKIQAQLKQMEMSSPFQMGSPFQMDNDSSSEEEDDNQEEMMLAQAGDGTGKGKYNMYNERVGIDELGGNVFTFINR